MSEESKNGGAIRVLVVEDDPDAQSLVASLLGLTGARLELTASLALRDATERLREETYDAILLDLALPDSSGIDTYRRVAAVATNTPIVIISGSADETTARAAIREGARDYIQKSSLTGAGLIRSLRYVLERFGASGHSGGEQIEQLRNHHKELLLRLAASGTGGVAGRMLGTRPLRELSSELFQSMVTRLGQVVDLQIDELVFGIEHDATRRLRDLAADLADGLAGPRDVVDLYAALLTEKEQAEGMSKDRVAAFSDIGRAATFELMGYLVASYRARVAPRVKEE